MRAIAIIITIVGLTWLFSCTKDEDPCEEKIVKIYNKYNTLMVKAQANHEQVMKLAEERDMEIKKACD